MVRGNSSLIFSNMPLAIEGDPVQIKRRHIEVLITRGVIVPVAQAVSKTLAGIVSSEFPLKLSHGLVDWSRVRHATSLNWMASDDDETVKWARTTTAAAHPQAILLYSADEPCVMGDFEYIIRELDVLIWSAPGPRVLFGAATSEGHPRISHDLLEFNGIDKLYGMRRSSVSLC